MSSAADTWRALTVVDTKSRALVTGTRWLDSVAWSGVKTDPAQTGAFPRTGLTYADGTAVPSDILPSELISANIELAMLLANDPDARDDLKSFGIKQLRAGSVSIDYFRPETETQISSPFPANVMALISQWIGGTGSAGGIISYGTCEKSRLLEDKLDFQHGI